MFTDEERQKFPEWIATFEDLCNDLKELEDIIRTGLKHGHGYARSRSLAQDHQWHVRSIKDHLRHAPPNLKPREITFGGGGMGGVYGPAVKAPGEPIPDIGDHEDRARIVEQEPATVHTASSDISAGIGPPIYIDPLFYSDWGWTELDPRPPPEPAPVPSSGGAEARSVK